MRFTISETTKQGLELIELRDTFTGTVVTVLPAFGALLDSFTIQLRGLPLNLIDNYQSLQEVKEILNRSYKSSKLSPFVCRIPEGKYEYAGNSYEFQDKFPDGSAIHGLLYNKAFTVIGKSGGGTEGYVEMQYDYHRDDPAYPFDYACNVKYILKTDQYLSVTTTINNTGTQTMPLADGWHPYFTLGGDTNSWELQFGDSSLVEFDDKLIPTGKLISNSAYKTPELLGDIFLDNCYLLNKPFHQPACVLRNTHTGLSLSFFPAENYPYLQIYTPPHRKSIAIENLSAAPDAFNNKMGLIELAPGNSQSFTLGYQPGKI